MNPMNSNPNSDLAAPIPRPSLPLSEFEINQLINQKSLSMNEPEKLMDEKSPMSMDEDTEGRSKMKTSLRLKYEAESQVIQKKLGSLEDIRKQLHLNQRKMCQLLLVDPSTWTRWIKDESKVPPHIFRALQWYMALIDKNPEWHPMNTYLGYNRTPQMNPQKSEQFRDDLQQLERQFHSTLQHQQKKLDEALRQNQIQWGWKLLIILNLAFWLWKILF